MTQKTEIKSSKFKLALMLIFSFIFIALGVFLVKNPEHFVSYRYKNIEYIRIMGIVLVLFCSVAFVYIPKKLFDKKSGLILDDIGINDNSSAVSVGLIRWTDIISIRTEKVRSTNFLIISVSNPEKYIKSSNKLTGVLLKANMKMYGSPLSISSSGLKCDFLDLEKIIKTEFEKHKKPNS